MSAYNFILNIYLFQNELCFYQISKKFICDLSTTGWKLLSHSDAIKIIAEMYLCPSWQFTNLSSTHFECFNYHTGIPPFFSPNHRWLL